MLDGSEGRSVDASDKRLNLVTHNELLRIGAGCVGRYDAIALRSKTPRSILRKRGDDGWTDECAAHIRFRAIPTMPWLLRQESQRLMGLSSPFHQSPCFQRRQRRQSVPVRQRLARQRQRGLGAAEEAAAALEVRGTRWQPPTETALRRHRQPARWIAKRYQC